LASALDANGLSVSAAPVAGFTRMTVPFSTRGCPDGRRGLWLRSEPPCAVGAVSVAPTPPGGSPQGFFGTGLPGLPPPCP
jgi:hypothetical protein